MSVNTQIQGKPVIPHEIHADYVRLCRQAHKAQRRGDAAAALRWYKAAHERLRAAETRLRIGFIDKATNPRGKLHRTTDFLTAAGRSERS